MKVLPMLSNKQVLSSIVCALLLLSCFLSLRAHNQPNDFYIDVDPLEDELLNLLTDEQDWDTTTRAVNEFTPLLVLEILTDPANNIEAQKVLLENLYLYTNPPVRRSLHDSAQYYFNYSCPAPCNWQMMIQPFYNLTHKVNFTKNSPVLVNYVDLLNPNILKKVDDLQLDIDVPSVLSLFYNAKLQSHRTGFMFGGLKNNGSWFFQFRAPVYYSLQNFYLTPAEIDAIQNEPLFAGFSGDVNKFIRQHLVSDRVGLGDTRMYVGNTLVDTEHMYLAAGGLTTIPTNFAFRRGLYGTNFNQNAPQPPFDFLTLFNLALSTDFENPALAIAMVEEFLIGALDRLTSIVAQESLGNGGHVGIGAFLDNEIDYNEHLALRTHVELEYLIPCKETRFYIQKKIPANFLDRDYTDPNAAEANLAFLNEQVSNTFYPMGIITRVHPGFIFKWATGIDYRKNSYALMFGHDLYWHQKEQLGNINAMPQIKDTLRKSIANKPSAFQNKLFGSAHYYGNSTNSDWNIGLYLDASCFNYGIGDSYNLAIQFEVNL
jgi:hypothetical protein